MSAVFVAMIALTEPSHTAPSQTTDISEIVLHAGRAAVAVGNWSAVADGTAAGGMRMQSANRGAPKIATALAAPNDYFELTFDATAGKGYRLWMRGRAERDSWANDSVHVQFNDSVNASGTPVYRFGTTDAAWINLEDCIGCGLAGWGWQDNGYGAGVLGPLVYLAASGRHTMRVQVREDGFAIDQIVLSSSRYLTSPPGALKNDATILAASDDGDIPPSPSITLVRGPYLQQVSSSGAVIVWATREAGAGEVRLRSGTSTVVAAAASSVYPASRTGLGFDYHQHEVSVTSLTPATTYEYDVLVDGIDPTAASDRLVTAPAIGTGTVRFIAFGDSGVGSLPQQQLAARMTADRFDFALHAGDIAYGTSDGLGGATHQTMDAWFFAMYRDWLPSRPVFPSIGNHDSRASNLNGQPYLDMFALSTDGRSAAYPDHAERYYSVDYGPVHIVALDTELAFQDTARRAEQRAWLERDLAATSQPWKIALFHRSPFSAGGEHGSDLAVRSAFSPVFEQYGVQLVISAHEHVYERTKPWSVGATGNPVTYVVTGGGGGPLYPAGSAEWTAYSAARHHYVRATAGECALTLEAVGLDGLTFDSAALDRCTPPSAGRDVVLHAAAAPIVAGNWMVVSDGSAAGGARLQNANRGAAKLNQALAAPADYFELTFEAEAGVPYRLWIRGKADANYWGNDSVHVQFDRSVTASGAAIHRIGTTDAAWVNLEDCSSCGLSGWGWQDNGYGAGILGAPLYFAANGTQRIRVQIREDGFGIDQIVLSPDRYLSAAPGALKNDSTILPRSVPTSNSQFRSVDGGSSL